MDDPRNSARGDQLKVMAGAAAQRPLVRRIGAFDHGHQRGCLARGEFLQRQETIDGVGVSWRAPDGPGRVVLPLKDRQSAANDYALFRNHTYCVFFSCENN